ncbi:TerD family protein [Streptomyces sp. DK15]|uniref:TerD family protein n=1 Tax=Streptomyces sp. DK15 TaxID=2957499 RepID=UPI0029B3A1E8|nr:TerD family protein [Streptomyces sp. DK15]MDX2389373.1 TerD family protein [Streptomyces sp. DK15]
MVNIIKGGNTTVPVQPVRIAVCHRQQPGAPVVNAYLLLLDARGRVRGDADLVFRNQPQHPSGAAHHLGPSEGGGQRADWLEVDLRRLEPSVERVVIAGSADGGTFGAVPGLYVQLTADDVAVAEYRVEDASTETTFVLGELYRRGERWKFRAVGQGYDSGPAGMAADFGIAAAFPVGPPRNAGAGERTPIAPAVSAAPSAPDPRWPKPITVSKVRGAVVPGTAAVPASSAAAPASAPGAVALPPVADAYLERSGRGNDILTVEASLPAGPVIIEVAVDGEGDFILYTVNKADREDELLFSTREPALRGRRLVIASGKRPLRLKVMSGRAWTVRVLPVTAAQPLTDRIETRGAEVLRYDGPPADLRIRYDGGGGGKRKGHFALYTARPEPAHRFDHELHVSESGRVKTTIPLNEGPLLVLVETNGGWSAELGGRKEQPGPAPAAVPAPAHVQAPAPAPQPVRAPATDVLLERSGRGYNVLTVEAPFRCGPLIVEARAGDDGYFVMYTLDRVNEDEELLFNTTQPGFHGRALAVTPADRPLRLKIETDDEWTVRVLPVGAALPLAGPVRGAGPEVLHYTGPIADLNVRYRGEDGSGARGATGWFALWKASPDLADFDDRDLLVNETKAAEATVPLTEGPLLILVEAEGPWTAEVRGLPQYP